jgi:hypothetical protein
VVSIRCVLCKKELTDDYVKEKVFDTDSRRQTFCNKQCLAQYRSKKQEILEINCVTCDKTILKTISIYQYIVIDGYSAKVYHCNEDCLKLFDLQICKSETFYTLKINTFLLAKFFNNRHSYLLSAFQRVLKNFYIKSNQNKEIIYYSMMLAYIDFKKIECRYNFNSDIHRLNYFLAIVNDKFYFAQNNLKQKKLSEKAMLNNRQEIEGKYVNTKDKALLTNVLKELL